MPNSGSNAGSTTLTGGRLHRNGWAVSPFRPDAFRRTQWALSAEICTQAICTFKQGRIADRRAQAQQYRASGLNLLIAVIVYWNSTYMADAVAHLRAIGEVVPDDLLIHTSPVGWEHISLSGDFLWDRAAAVPAGRRPLNLGPRRRAA